MNDIKHRSWILLIGAAVAVTAFLLGRHSISSGPLPSTPAPVVAKNEERSVAVTAQALALMDIEVVPVIRGSLAASQVVPGIVVASPAGQAIVTARVAGTLSRIEKHLGDEVKKGDVLARAVSRDAAAVRGQQRAAAARAAAARAALARERQLFGQRVTPRQDLESAEAAAVAAEAEEHAAGIAAEALHVDGDGQGIALVSPMNGRVTQASAVQGAYVEAETELFRVADPRLVQVQLSVPMTEAAALSAGDAARVTTQSGLTLQARVTSVTSALDARTGTATAVLAFVDPPVLPAAGELVRAWLQPHAAPDAALIVPEGAIQMLDGREVVFVRTAEGFRASPVSLGARNGTQRAVLSGLGPDDAIAGRNAFLLKAEADKGAGEDE